MSEAENGKRIYCNRCRGETRHHLVASHSYHTDVEDGEYILWVCAGCDTGTMEDSYTAAYLDSGEPESIFYPDRAEHNRIRKYFMNLPKKLEGLYREVISAHNANLNVLCAIGLRGLVEGVCADKSIQGRNLDEKIEAMKALLPENIVQNLHGFRFMGNRAAHELEAPSSGELQVAIDLIEDILNYLYDLDYKARLFAGLNSAQKRNP
jgi:hypothetical protein